MKEKLEVTKYACDAEGCTVVHYVEDEASDGPPDGLHGTVYEIASWGGGGSADWYACKPGHIRGAVEGAMKRERDEYQRSRQ